MAASDTAAAGAVGGAREGEPPFQHDDPGAAAFVFRVVPQLSPHLEALSYWTFSDVSPKACPKRAPMTWIALSVAQIFEENSIPRTEFHPVGLPYDQPHYVRAAAPFAVLFRQLKALLYRA